MKKKLLVVVCYTFMVFCLHAKPNCLVSISTSTDNITESEATWLAPVVAEKLEANLAKYTDFIFVNSVNRKDIFEIQKQSESIAFDENDAIEIGKLKNADYVLFTNIRKIDNLYTISVRLTDVTTGINKISAILSSPRTAVQNLYSSNGCAVDEITIEICKVLGQPLSEKEINFIMKGELSLQIEEKQSFYDADVKLYNTRINELNKEIDSLAFSTDLKSVSQEEKLKAEKNLIEEKLKLAKENQKRVAEEIKNIKADELKNSERTSEQIEKLKSISEELNKKVTDIRNTKFENQSLLGQIQVIELKKQAIVDIHDSIINERNNIVNSTLNEIHNNKEQIDGRPYRSAELLGDGRTPSEFALEQRKILYNKTKDKLIAKGQADFDNITYKLQIQQNTLLSEINEDYTKLNSRKINTLGNELLVTYGPYDGDRCGWNLYVTVKTDDIIIFQTKSFLSFEHITGKNPIDFATDDYFAYLDEVDFYDSLFIRGVPILIFELEYSAKPEAVSKPSHYNFDFYNFKCYDTNTISVNGHNLSSSFIFDLSLDQDSIIRKMTPVCDLQPALKGFSTLENLIGPNPEEKIMEITGIANSVKPLAIGTNGSYGTKGRYAEFGNWPQTIKDNNITILDTEPIKYNGWLCYRGSDNHFYIKTKANPLRSDFVFSNGTKIVEGNEYYFKLEPIKWRIVSNYYQGGKLLIAECILTSHQFDNTLNNYKNSEIREWLNDSFINKAFSEEDIKKIKSITIDNSVNSTGYKTNNYTCENTFDKVFLLSYEEAINVLSDYKKKNYELRRRKTTDYARATGSFSQRSNDYRDTCYWWLRTPDDSYNNYTRYIDYGGNIRCTTVNTPHMGVIPALTISF